MVKLFRARVLTRGLSMYNSAHKCFPRFSRFGLHALSFLSAKITGLGASTVFEKWRLNAAEVSLGQSVELIKTQIGFHFCHYRFSGFIHVIFGSNR